MNRNGNRTAIMGLGGLGRAANLLIDNYELLDSTRFQPEYAGDTFQSEERLPVYFTPIDEYKPIQVIPLTDSNPVPFNDYVDVTYDTPVQITNYAPVPVHNIPVPMPGFPAGLPGGCLTDLCSGSGAKNDEYPALNPGIPTPSPVYASAIPAPSGSPASGGKQIGLLPILLSGVALWAMFAGSDKDKKKSSGTGLSGVKTAAKRSPVKPKGKRVAAFSI